MHKNSPFWEPTGKGTPPPHIPPTSLRLRCATSVPRPHCLQHIPTFIFSNTPLPNPKNTCCFPCKMALRLKKVCYKVSVWKLSATKLQGIHSPIYPCINDCGGRPLVRENVVELTHHPVAKRRFSIHFRS